MIQSYVRDNGRLRPVDGAPDPLDGLVWIDLIDPTDEEEAGLEARLGIDLPSKEDMEEIEISSRLYREDGAVFMTAILPAQADGDDPHVAPVSFVLTHDQLITVRYHDPRAFATFAARARKVAAGYDTPDGVLVALLEAIVDRLADILERTGRDIDRISRGVFKHGGARPTKSRDFQKVLEDLGRAGDLTSNLRDSLVTLERMSGYLAQVAIQRKCPEDTRESIKTLSRDVHSLSDHSGFLSQKITFLLDATLGMISIEQSAIIKIFSVVAFVFLPPTLIASIYGMNFEVMPELGWRFGYPMAIAMMVASAVLPYLFFKHRGWL
jgi:magnesium transporter